MTTIPELEKRLALVENRNLRVTADKTWETSLTRRFSIAGLTYLVVSTYLIVIGNEKPYVNALVPVMGYVLSTLALAQVKASWIHRLIKRQKR